MPCYRTCSTFLSYPVVRRGLTIGFSAPPKLGDKVIVWCKRIPWTTFVVMPVMVAAWWFRLSARICWCGCRRGLLCRILPLWSPLRHWKNGFGILDSVTLASRNRTGFWPLRWRVWRLLRRRSWAYVRHVLCVSRTSAASRVSRVTGMLVSLRS
jgi:hypothetical protein